MPFLFFTLLPAIKKSSLLVVLTTCLFSLMVSSAYAAVVDSDADGLWDSWENLHFGDLSTANAISDINLDGKSDLDHFADGTFPGTKAALNGGSFHSIALKIDGTVEAWGDNSSAQTTIPAGLVNVVGIATGYNHSLALKADGTVEGWGENSNNQTTIPDGLANVTVIAAGSHHSLALTSDGTVVAWGYNSNGQTTLPGGLANVTGIAAGFFHSLALKTDGTVEGWGRSNEGQITIPDGLATVVAIAAGDYHSLVLKADGTVVTWGIIDGSSIDFGQVTGIPADLTNITNIAAGKFHSLALTSDGTVVAWGSNGAGQSTIPDGLTNVVDIAAGTNHSLALKADGTVVGWGYNNRGQTTIPDGLLLDTDHDADGVPNTLDNCPTILNADQLNTDLDSQGNVCDDDDDNDGLTDVFELANGLEALDDGSIDINNGADGDPDADGFTNLEEQAAGSDASAGGAASNPGIFNFDTATVSVDEDAGTGSINVTRTGGSLGYVSVVCLSKELTGDGVATDNIDYINVELDLEWTHNDPETVKTCTFDIIEDSEVEGNETFQLYLDEPYGGAKLGAS